MMFVIVPDHALKSALNKKCVCTKLNKTEKKTDLTLGATSLKCFVLCFVFSN